MTMSPYHKQHAMLPQRMGAPSHLCIGTPTILRPAQPTPPSSLACSHSQEPLVHNGIWLSSITPLSPQYAIMSEGYWCGGVRPSSTGHTVHPAPTFSDQPGSKVMRSPRRMMRLGVDSLVLDHDKRSTTRDPRQGIHDKGSLITPSTEIHAQPFQASQPTCRFYSALPRRQLAPAS